MWYFSFENIIIDVLETAIDGGVSSRFEVSSVLQNYSRYKPGKKLCMIYFVQTGHPAIDILMCRPCSSVGSALDSVWWAHTFQLQKSGVRGETGARCLSGFWRVWLRLVAGRDHLPAEVSEGDRPCVAVCVR